MAYTRQNLIDEALANLGIIQQTPTVGTGTQTRVALINKVLFNLGILSEGRPARPAEVATVTAEIELTISTLSANGIVSLADSNAVPNQYFLPFAAIVSDSLRDEFGAVGEEAAKLMKDAADGRRTLKNLSQGPAIVSRNLDAILADLAAREIVYLVDTSDIPQEWYQHLAAIVADRCKSKGFELDGAVIQSVAAAGAQAMIDLRELTRGRPSYLPLRTSYM